VSVINHISLTVSGNTVLCAGETTTLTAFGASSYMWSNNQFSSSIVTTPPASTVFTVIGADGTCLDTVLVALQVNALPSITASSASSVICAGESVSLSASGAGTYSWSSGESSAVISVSPPVNTTYTVTGTDENGCASMYTLLQVVNACVGITEPQRIVDLMQLYPNPNTGEFTIENSAEIHLKVINTLGQVVLEKDLDSGKNTIWLYEQPKGIYFVELKRAGAIKLIKIIKN
jgi:hypothetical protein